MFLRDATPKFPLLFVSQLTYLPHVTPENFKTSHQQISVPFGPARFEHMPWAGVIDVCVLKVHMKTTEESSHAVSATVTLEL